MAARARVSPLLIAGTLAFAYLAFTRTRTLLTATATIRLMGIRVYQGRLVLTYEVTNVGNKPIEVRSMAGNMMVDNRAAFTFTTRRPHRIEATSTGMVEAEVTANLVSIVQAAPALYRKDIPYTVAGTANVGGTLIPFRQELTLTNPVL